MKTVWIYKGLPGSGKSTKAKEQVLKSNCSIKRVNKDDLRAMLDVSKHSKGNERFVVQLRNHIILTALDMGKSVIVDDTNFHEKHEEDIRKLVKYFNEGMYGDNVPKSPVQVEVKFFDVSPEECIKRDLQRPNSVGSKVIMQMYNKYLKPKTDRIQKVLEQDDNLLKAIIVDIDGTVALNTGGRSPFDGTRVDEDEPNKNVVELVKNYLTNPNYHVIFLSGREGNAVCRKLTKEWLDKVFKECDTYYGFKLYMRNEGDTRKDSIIKKELFEANIKDKFYVSFVVDDRNQVIKMWRDLGLTCLQVAYGDF